MSSCQIVRLPNCQVTKLAGYQIVRLQNCQVTKLSGYQIVRLPNCRVTKLSGYHIVRLPNCWLPNCPVTKLLVTNNPPILFSSFEVINSCMFHFLKLPIKFEYYHLSVIQKVFQVVVLLETKESSFVNKYIDLNSKWNVTLLLFTS